VDAITAADLADAVTAYAIILAGLTALWLPAWMGRQPRRWRVAYWGGETPSGSVKVMSDAMKEASEERTWLTICSLA
jgi:hypothetical protein